MNVCILFSIPRKVNRHRSYQETFMNEEKAQHAVQFADLCIHSLHNA